MKKTLALLVLLAFALPLFPAEPVFHLVGKEPAKLDNKVFAILGKQKKEVVVVEPPAPAVVQVEHKEPAPVVTTPVVAVPVNNNPWQWNPTTRTWWRYENVTPTFTLPTSKTVCGPTGCIKVQ